jgi:hypothetical protein
MVCSLSIPVLVRNPMLLRVGPKINRLLWQKCSRDIQCLKVSVVNSSQVLFALNSCHTPRMFGIETKKHVESYSPVKMEDCEGLLSSSETLSLDGHSTKILSHRCSWISTGMMLLCTAVLSALFGAWAGRNGLNADDFSIRHISEYCTSDLASLHGWC